nr:putative transporter [Quercus suber]
MDTRDSKHAVDVESRPSDVTDDWRELHHLCQSRARTTLETRRANPALAGGHVSVQLARQDEPGQREDGGARRRSRDCAYGQVQHPAVDLLRAVCPDRALSGHGRQDVRPESSAVSVTKHDLQSRDHGTVEEGLISQRRPCMMFVFGAMTLLTVAAYTWSGLVALRWFLGMAESAFFPLVIYYQTQFYRRGELARRLAIFYAAQNISGAFGGLLAYGTFQITGGAIWKWKYLFVIEGSLTMAMAVVAFVFLPRSAAQAKFLNDEEKKLAFHRIQVDSSAVVEEKFRFKEAAKVLKHWTSWMILAIEICLGIPLQSVNLFLPSIVARLNYGTVKTNLYTVVSITTQIPDDRNKSSDDHITGSQRYWCRHAVGPSLCVGLHALALPIRGTGLSLHLHGHVHLCRHRCRDRQERGILRVFHVSQRALIVRC